MAKNERSPLQIVKTIGVGGGIAAAITLGLAMLCGFLLSTEVIPEGLMPSMALPISLLSALAGSWIAAKSAGQQRLIVALGAGIVYLLIALLIRGLWFHGDWSFTPVAAAAVGALAAGLLASKQKKRRK